MNIVISMIEHDGRFAFLQNSDGTWDFPAGIAEADQRVEDVSAEDSKNRTGLETTCVRIVDAYKKGNNFAVFIHARSESSALMLRQPEYFQKAEWKTPEEILSLSGQRIAPPVKTFMETTVLLQRHSLSGPAYTLGIK